MILIFTDILPSDINCNETPVRHAPRQVNENGLAIEMQQFVQEETDDTQQMHTILSQFIKDKSCLSKFESNQS